MVHLNSLKDCCGCMACLHVCSHGAIKISKDTFGYAQAVYDATKCVECGECDSVCDFNSGRMDEPNHMPMAYAVRHKDISEVERSQSGAAFVALSDEVLRHNGVIYGAAFGDNFRVTHSRAVSSEGRDAMRGSKYVQSDMMGIYPAVKRDLMQGYHVLFSGLPCQVAAMRQYIPQDLQKNLLLVDLICHGVSGPGLWKSYLEFLEKRYHGKIVKVSFRDKKFGWKSQRESFTFSDGRTVYPRFLLYQNMTLRESCTRCPYTNLNRPSDITIGDYWGLERLSKNFASDNRGCSLVLCNTKKGQRAFEDIKKSIDYLQSNSVGQYLQPNLKEPSVIPNIRTRFERIYLKYGIRTALWCGGHIGIPLFMRRVKDKLRRMIQQ